MTTKIGKVLAIFIGVMGIAFLGFAGVTVVGGPNWDAEMQAPDLRDYVFVFEKSEGEVTTWTTTRRVAEKGDGDEEPQVVSVGKATKIAPETIVAARKDLSARQTDETDFLEEDLKVWQANVEKVKQLIDADQKAVELRLSELQAELDGLNQKIAELSDAIRQTAAKAQDTQAEAARRQEDVLLYEGQLEELRSERFRATEQQKLLRDRLVRIRDTNDRLERRNNELKQATTKG